MRVITVLFLVIVLGAAALIGLGYLHQQQAAAQPATTQTGFTPGQGGFDPSQISQAQLEQFAAARGIDPAQIQQFIQARQGGQTETTAAATSLALLGTVEANEAASLNFQTSGTVAEILVKEGDVVQAGTVLARLDDSSAQIAVHDAELNLENAQLNLQTLLEPPSDSDLQQARLNVASAQASYGETANNTSASDIQAAQLNVQQAQDAYDLAVQERANMNASPEQTSLQDAAVGAASFNLQIAQLRLQDLQTPNNAGSLWAAGARVQIAELQLAQLQDGPSTTQLTTAQLNIQIAQANLASAQTDLARTVLTAPISGVVSAVNIESGATVSGGTAAVVITDLSKLWLTAPLHELDLASITEGMPATIKFDALPNETFDATLDQVAWLGTESNGIVQYNVRFSVNTDDSRIRPGMTGEADIDLTSS